MPKGLHKKKATVKLYSATTGRQCVRLTGAGTPAQIKRLKKIMPLEKTANNIQYNGEEADYNNDCFDVPEPEPDWRTYSQTANYNTPEWDSKRLQMQEFFEMNQIMLREIAKKSVVVEITCTCWKRTVSVKVFRSYSSILKF
jgi:hypothetical protein